ncbi:MAG: DoxX family protein [Sandaracinaceae bacterium]
MLLLRIAITVLMALAGGAKLLGAKPIAAQFEEFGLPRAAMYVVGVLEVAAAVGIQLDRLAFFASTGIALLMVGAVANHLRVRHPIGQAVPSVVVLLLAAAHSALSWSAVAPRFGA